MLKLLAITYGLLTGVVFLLQRKMLYHPDNPPADYLEQAAKEYRLEPWKNATGERIGWKRLTTEKSPHSQVLILHGNAGSAIDRVDYADGLRGVLPCEVYILEYPGYGGRPGSPTQSHIFQAADEAMDLLAKQGRVYLIGESLGTGVASYLAGSRSEAVAAVLLVAPYYSLVDVGQSHLPIFPVRLMMLDRYPAATYLAKYRGRVAVVLAGEDEVIPKKFGRKLYDAYSGPKKVWEVPGAYHNDLPERPPEWWHDLLVFWQTGT